MTTTATRFATILPKFKSHKTVQAIKIGEIRQSDIKLNSTPNTWDIVPADENYAPIQVTHEFITKHSPQPGGYYVLYADGYHSYSPAEPFEDGYTLITGNDIDLAKFAGKIFYGPHRCDDCNCMIVRVSLADGGDKFDAISPVYDGKYPTNHPELPWELHVCKASHLGRPSPVDRSNSIPMHTLFAVHILSSDGIDKAQQVAVEFNSLLHKLIRLCDENTREFSLVKTKLEEACFFAKKVVASDTRNQAREVPRPDVGNAANLTKATAPMSGIGASGIQSGTLKGPE